jgi:hypothetical protein
MSQVSIVRISLLISGLAAIALSFALQGGYATDIGPELSGPSTTAIIAMAGVFAIALSMIRRRRK